MGDLRDNGPLLSRQPGSQPLVSVVMPVRDAEATVRAAIASLFDSPFRNWELIAADDGSIDQTRSILKSFPTDRVNVLALPRAGIVHALNHAIEHATGRYIARMDSDDACHPLRLPKQCAALEAGDVDLVGCRVRIVDLQGEPVPTMQRYQDWINSCCDPGAIHAMRFVESPIVHPTAMAKREVFELGYRNGPWPEDYDLWLRAIEAGFRFGKLPEVLFEWRDHERRLTRCDPRYSRKAFDTCRRTHLLAGPLRETHQVDLWGIGNTGKSWFRWLRSEGFRVRLLIDVNPRKIGQRIHGIPVISPDRMPKADGTPLLVAVGAVGAKDQIEPHLTQTGYLAGRDAWFVA